MVAETDSSMLSGGLAESEGLFQTPTHQIGDLNSLWQHSSAAWIVGTCLVLVVLTVVSLLVIGWYRKRLLSKGQESSSEAWTLDDIRRLREEGSLTEEEYQRIRAAIIASYRGQHAGREKPDSSPEKWDWTA